MKTFPRFLRLFCAGIFAVTLIVFTTACPDKLKNLAAKAQEAERELRSFNSETDKMQAKIKELSRLERLSPPPTNAIAQQNAEIKAERDARDAEHGKYLKKVDEIIKEFGELNNTEWGEALSYVTNALPLLRTFLEHKYGGVTNALKQVTQDATNKLNQQSSTLTQQTNLANTIRNLPPGPARDQALNDLDLTNAQAEALSFLPEAEAAGFIAAELEAVDCIPVVAGSFVPQTTVVLEEGLPSGLSHLDSGVLAPGTQVMFQLPPDWYITAPVTASSPNLVLQFYGNQPGTNTILIRVASEIIPGLTNDSITVTFHGVHIGQTLGRAESCMFVYPGRAQRTAYCVLPNPPPSFAGPTLQPGGMKLSWDGGGTLQQSATVRGPYSNVLNQANPQIVPTTGSTRFFRISRP